MNEKPMWMAPFECSWQVWAASGRRKSLFPLVRLDVVVAGLHDVRIGLLEEAALIGVIEHETTVVLDGAQDHRCDALRGIEADGVRFERSLRHMHGLLTGSAKARGSIAGVICLHAARNP